ncbi:MAG: STAS domain-containing protein [Acidobacteriaceae bacterium]|nr:STAS domain-containing protein [Acidobacteriaceae bacterium]
MSVRTDLHADPIAREQVIVKYLARKLDPSEAAQFESHYLFCRDCYEELRASELLVYALGQIVIDRRREDDIAIVRFSRQAELTGSSMDLKALVEIVRLESDTKVLIDLSNVSRIDSAGLGMLMNCYCHAVNNRGVLKLLRPNRQVKRALNITKIDSVLPALEDEEAALRSFQAS